jgi:hypothetical protein
VRGPDREVVGDGDLVDARRLGGGGQLEDAGEASLEQTREAGERDRNTQALAHRARL